MEKRGKDAADGRTYHQGLPAPPMLRPCNYGMGDVDSSVRKESYQYRNREPLEDLLGVMGISLERLGNDHCTPRPLREWSPTGTDIDLIAICTDILSG